MPNTYAQLVANTRAITLTKLPEIFPSWPPWALQYLYAVGVSTGAPNEAFSDVAWVLFFPDEIRPFIGSNREDFEALGLPSRTFQSGAFEIGIPTGYEWSNLEPLMAGLAPNGSAPGLVDFGAVFDGPDVFFQFPTPNDFRPDATNYFDSLRIENLLPSFVFDEGDDEDEARERELTAQRAKFKFPNLFAEA